MRFKQVFSEIIFYSSMVTSSNSRRFFDDRRLIWSFNFSHRFLMGHKSGFMEWHDRTVILFFWSHTVTDLDVCEGSLSCWKVNLDENVMLIVVDFYPEFWYRLQISFLLLQLFSSPWVKTIQKHHRAAAMFLCRLYVLLRGKPNLSCDK